MKGYSNIMYHDDTIETDCPNHSHHPEIPEIVSERLPSEEEMYLLSELFKLFGDSTRIRILVALFEGELCVGDIAVKLEMSQTAISHQLRVLKQNHLIKYRRQGKSMIYSLADNHVKTIIDCATEHIEE